MRQIPNIQNLCLKALMELKRLAWSPHFYRNCVSHNKASAPVLLHLWNMLHLPTFSDSKPSDVCSLYMPPFKVSLVVKTLRRFTHFSLLFFKEWHSSLHYHPIERFLFNYWQVSHNISILYRTHANHISPKLPRKKSCSWGLSPCFCLI